MSKKHFGISIGQHFTQHMHYYDYDYYVMGPSTKVTWK